MTSQPESKPLDQLTDTELQRLIAEMRGWTVQHEDNMIVEMGTLGEHKEPHYVLRDPDGNRISHLYYGGPMPEDEAWKRLPHWPQDTHAAAVDLLAEMGQSGYYLQFFLGRWVIGQDTKWIRSHDHPARAICEAWVMWKRGQNER